MAPTAPAPAPLHEASAPGHGPDHTAHGTARDPLFADLLALASDLWWTGRPAAHDLWPRLDPVRWEALNHNPLAMLREGALSHAGPDWREDAQALLTLWRAYHRRPMPKGSLNAYFCMEYGLHESLPIYSGGLGMLAGDHLRSACDTDLNLVAVGIFWSEGYFRQVLHDGRQMPAFCRNDPARLPLKPVLGPDGRPVVVRVPLGATLFEQQALRLANQVPPMGVALLLESVVEHWVQGSASVRLRPPGWVLRNSVINWATTGLRV